MSYRPNYFPAAVSPPFPYLCNFIPGLFETFSEDICTSKLQSQWVFKGADLDVELLWFKTLKEFLRAFRVERKVFSSPSLGLAVLRSPLHWKSSLPATDNDLPRWMSYSCLHLHSCPQPSALALIAVQFLRKFFPLSPTPLFQLQIFMRKQLQLPFLCFFIQVLLGTAPGCDPLKDVQSLPRGLMA